MANLEDVRRIALSLPGSSEDEGRQFGVSVVNGGKRKLFVWAWLERVHPKKARVPNEEVVGVRVADLEDKEALLAAGGPALFTEPHYDGYPAVLVRLTQIEPDELEALIVDAWRCRAPRRLVSEWEQSPRAAEAPGGGEAAER